MTSAYNQRNPASLGEKTYEAYQHYQKDDKDMNRLCLFLQTYFEDVAPQEISVHGPPHLDRKDFGSFDTAQFLLVHKATKKIFMLATISVREEGIPESHLTYLKVPQEDFDGFAELNNKTWYIDGHPEKIQLHECTGEMQEESLWPEWKPMERAGDVAAMLKFIYDEHVKCGNFHLTE